MKLFRGMDCKIEKFEEKRFSESYEEKIGELGHIFWPTFEEAEKCFGMKYIVEVEIPDCEDSNYYWENAHSLENWLEAESVENIISEISAENIVIVANYSPADSIYIIFDTSIIKSVKWHEMATNKN